MGNDQENSGRKLTLFSLEKDNLLELRPLSSGLGFKDRVSSKKINKNTSLRSEASADAGMIDLGVEDASDDGTLQIEQDGNIRLFNKESFGPVLSHSGHDGLIKRTAKKSGESVIGVVIDMLLVFAISIFSLALLIEFKLISINEKVLFDGRLNIELLKLFVIFSAVFLSYRVLARAFYGKTLGEWANRHQLGLYTEQESFSYIFKVFFRECFTLLTGFLVLPFLSTLAKTDIGYYFSGLHTYVEYKK